MVEKRYAGRDIVKGVPKYVTVTNQEVRKVIEPIFEEVVKLISSLLKDTPPELSSDVFKNGILLTGGGSLTEGIAEFVNKRIKVPTKVVDNPLTCVAEGTKILLKNIESFYAILTPSEYCNITIFIYFNVFAVIWPRKISFQCIFFGLLVNLSYGPFQIVTLVSDIPSEIFFPIIFPHEVLYLKIRIGN